MKYKDELWHGFENIQCKDNYYYYLFLFLLYLEENGWSKTKQR